MHLLAAVAYPAGCFALMVVRASWKEGGRAREAIDVADGGAPAELSSGLLDLTGLRLADLGSLRSSQLTAAIRHTVDEAVRGWFGDSIQGQRD
jgi:hypothetical protein